MKKRVLSPLKGLDFSRYIARALTGQSVVSMSWLLQSLFKAGITTAETACVPSFANWFLAMREGEGVS